MEGHCSTGQSPQWAVVPMEGEEEEVVVVVVVAAAMVTNFFPHSYCKFTSVALVTVVICFTTCLT